MESLQQLYLSSVIEIVRGDAVHVLRVGPGGPPPLDVQPCHREAGDDRPEQPVLLLQQADVAPPRGRVGLGRERRPVAPGAREFESGIARQAAAHDVLPVGCVQHDFPDVVASARWPPQRLARQESPDRSPQGRAVPGSAIERLVEDVEQQSEAPVSDRALHDGRNSFGIGCPGSSSNQIADATHHRFPSQKSCSALMPRPTTGPSAVRRSSYVLNTCTMFPYDRVTRWTSRSKNPSRTIAESDPSTN